MPADAKTERGFRVLRVAGKLPFDATGILASIAVPVANGGVPIFAISTFDTDYVLVRESSLDAVVRLLRDAGHSVSK